MSKLLNNIWIVNLDRSEERMTNIKKNFQSLNVTYNRFSAIDGKHVLNNKNISNVCKYLLCNPSMIGCNLSHKTLWKQLIESNEDAYIILEDDMLLNEKFIRILPMIELCMSKYKIDVLNLNCSIDINCTLKRKEFIIEDIAFGKPYAPLSTCAYIITKQGASKLLSKLSNAYYHVDFEILMVRDNLINYYTCNPPLLSIDYQFNTTLASKKPLIFIKLLETLRLKETAWLLNVPLLTICYKFEINLYFVFLCVLLCINILKSNNIYIYIYIGIELCIYILYSF